MSDAKKFLRYWLPLVIWMALIYSASGDAKSVAHTSRFLEPFLKFFWPDIPVKVLDKIIVFVRKTAHTTEYAVLAWFWWRALRQPVRKNPRPWLWRLALLAWLLATLYAATDEFHQSFVHGREASVVDVLIDSGGAAFGLLALWGFGRWRKSW